MKNEKNDLFEKTPEDVWDLPSEMLCEIFLLYFDEEKGHIPLIVLPDEEIKKDEDKMHLISIHSIWFLDIKQKHDLDRVDLEYGGRMYFAKKFLVPSERKKRRAGSEEDQDETIVMILSLPTDLDIFGGDLLNIMTNTLISKYKYNLYHLIESELASQSIIKNGTHDMLIEKGNNIKSDVKTSLQGECQKYFFSVIKKTDATSLKIQKATSFLALRGLKFDHLMLDKKDIDFSNIRLFDMAENENEQPPDKNRAFKVISVNTIEDTKEVEVHIKNVMEEEFDNVRVKISFIKDFFEKDVLTETVSFWGPKEEVLFSFPLIEHGKEYLVQVLQEHFKEKLYSRTIELANMH